MAKKSQNLELDESIKDNIPILDFAPLEPTELSDWVDSRGTPEFQDEVLSALTDQEIIRGLPTTTGLRRYVKTHYNIIESISTLCFNIAIPHEDIKMVFRGSACNHVLTVELPNGRVVTHGKSADAFPDNLEGRFRYYPSAMADTRAEGRSLVNFLGLNCVTADEISNIKEFEDVDEKKEPSEIQWSAFDVLFARKNIDAGKFFNLHGKEVSLKVISAMNKSQAKTLLGIGNRYQQGLAVPEDILGYAKSWLTKVKQAQK